jgi:hypothetical protein
MDEFYRGKYGEIVPAYMGVTLDEDELLSMLRDFVAAHGENLHIPQYGESRKGLLRLAATYAHTQGMRDALAETHQTDIAVTFLYLVETGAGINLAPLFMPDQMAQTFVPVFQKTGNGQWRLGLPGYGRVETFAEPVSAVAIEKAQHMVVQWYKEEEAKLNAWIKDADLGRVYSNPLTVAWEQQIIKQKFADMGIEGYVLEAWGAHSTFVISTPSGIRILSATTPVTAVRHAYFLLKVKLERDGVKPLPVEQMLALLPPLVRQSSGHWTFEVNGKKGDVLVSPKREISIFCDNRYTYLVPKRDRLSLQDGVGRGKGKRRLELVWPDIVPTDGWEDANNKIRVGLAWAAWESARWGK